MSAYPPGEIHRLRRLEARGLAPVPDPGGVGQQMMERDPLPLRRAAGSHRATGSARSSRPDSASSKAATAANCLLTEQIWNRVRGVHHPAPASASPARRLEHDAAGRG